MTGRAARRHLKFVTTLGPDILRLEARLSSSYPNPSTIACLHFVKLLTARQIHLREECCEGATATPVLPMANAHRPVLRNTNNIHSSLYIRRQ
jgi:hypothetical protein